jgi:hypothetical protein
MGQDKSLINSNVNRLAREMISSGCDRIIVMCGTLERSELFELECIPDLAESLGESIFELVSQIGGQIQLAPCDAYLADSELFGKICGVPVDDKSVRQPLLANFAAKDMVVKSAKISEIFDSFPSCEGGLKARNTNTPKEFMEIQRFLKQEDLSL